MIYWFNTDLRFDRFAIVSMPVISQMGQLRRTGARDERNARADKVYA